MSFCLGQPLAASSPVAQVFNLCPIGAPLGVAHAPAPDACSELRKPNRVSDGGHAGSAAPRGVAHAPSLDACSGHPALRSLDAALASPSWLRSASNAGSRGTGNPSLIPVSYKPKAVRPRASDAGRGVWWRFAPRLTALGLDRCAASAGRTALAACQFQPRRRRKAYIADARPMPESTIAGGSGTATISMRYG